MKYIYSKHAPKVVGPYSQGIQVNGFIFCAGQIGLDPKVGEMVEGIEDQTHQVIHNLEAVLKEARVSLDSVVKTTIFLKNMSDYQVVNEIYGKYFDNHKPARSTVEVASLPRNALIEIECIAVKELPTAGTLEVAFSNIPGAELTRGFDVYLSSPYHQGINGELPHMSAVKIPLQDGVLVFGTRSVRPIPESVARIPVSVQVRLTEVFASYYQNNASHKFIEDPDSAQPVPTAPVTREQRAAALELLLGARRDDPDVTKVDVGYRKLQDTGRQEDRYYLMTKRVDMVDTGPDHMPHADRTSQPFLLTIDTNGDFSAQLLDPRNPGY